MDRKTILGYCCFILTFLVLVGCALIPFIRTNTSAKTQTIAKEGFRTVSEYEISRFTTIKDGSIIYRLMCVKGLVVLLPEGGGGVQLYQKGASIRPRTCPDKLIRVYKPIDD